MGKFKDRLDSLGDEKLNNEKCEPGGRVIDFKTRAPVTPPGVTPPGIPPTEGGGADQICSCVGDKLDELIDDIRNTYPYGPSFNTGKLFTQASTPIEIDQAITQPSPNLSIVGFYDSIPIAPKRNNINARQIWVIADPDGAVSLTDPFLYVRYSNGPNATYSVEVVVRVGEDWEFRDIFEFRIRASVAGQQYRITTDPHHTTYVSTVVNIPPGPVPITSPPVANRPAFVTQNISVGLVDQILPNIPVPNGFSLVVRSNPFNAGNSRIFISSSDATVPGNRNTLAAGDSVRLFITNADLVHVAANIVGQTIDLVVEQ